MIMELNYTFTPLIFLFFVKRVKNKENKHKISGSKFGYFPTKLKNFLIKILMIILKCRCHSKLILGLAVFQLLSELAFSLKLSLFLNHCLGWH